MVTHVTARLRAFLLAGVAGAMLLPAQASAQAAPPTPQDERTAPATDQPAVPDAAGSASAPAQDADQDQAGADDAGPDIVVTGFRQSLEAALNVRRNAGSIVDAISSDGIGKFPDLNLAESIQRITGVQINRELSGGRRATVSVRGLPSTFGRTTFQGQSIANPIFSDGGAGIGFPFGIIESDTIGGVEVIKSPTAATDIGGLSGTVNVKTPSPLARSERFSLTATVKGRYEDQTEAFLPSSSASLTYQVIPGELGVNLAFGVSDQDYRVDQVTIQAYTRTAPNAATGSPELFRPNEARFVTERNFGYTATATGGVEWRPSDDFEAKVSGIYVKNDIERTLDTLQVASRAGTVTTDLQPNSQNGFGTISDVRFTNPLFVYDSREIPEDWYTWSGVASARWSPGRLTVDGAVGYTKARRDQGFEFYQVTQNALTGGLSNGITADLRTGRGEVGDFALSTNVNPASFVDLNQPFTFLSGRDARPTDNTPNGYRFQGGGRVSDLYSDELSAELNLRYAFDGPLTAIQVGGKYRDITEGRTSWLSQLNGARLGNLGNDLVRDVVTSRGNTFFGGDLGDGFPAAQWVGLNVRDVTARLTPISGVTPTGPNQRIGRYGLLEVRDSAAAGQTFQIDQELISAYGMAEWGFDLGAGRISGNAGVRYYDLKRDSAGLQVVSGAVLPTAREDAFDGWLPAVNVLIAPVDNLQFRVGYTESITLPNPQDFGIARSVDTSNPGFGINVDLGAPGLAPFSSQNFDVAIEWYNRPGSVLAATYFFKNVQGLAVRTPICPADGLDLGFGALAGAPDSCRIAATGGIINVNTITVGDFEIEGFELAAQQNLTFLPAPFDKFGFLANYTRIDVESAVPGLFINNLSKNTVNAIGYYETDRFGIRLAYNWRDEYPLASTNSFFGANRVIASRGQLDLSANFNVTDRITIGFDAFNLTDAERTEFEIESDRVRLYEDGTQTYMLSLRASL